MPKRMPLLVGAALLLLGAKCGRTSRAPAQGTGPAKPSASGASAVPVVTAAKAPVAVKEAPDLQADSADQVMYGVRAVLTDASVTRGLLLATRGLAFEDGTRLELRSPSVTLVNALGVKGAVITANTGTYLLRKGRFEARGHVVVTRKDGKRLESERIVFDLARNLLSGDSGAMYSDSTTKRKTPVAAFELDPNLAEPVKLKAKPAVKPNTTKPSR
ncbi:MAG: hypothetical protein IPP90_20575 [Gemmatimonadaceae bacterium]|nr:hypothetical protein [Gemmatimonadaceae bacterium]